MKGNYKLFVLVMIAIFISLTSLNGFFDDYVLDDDVRIIFPVYSLQDSDLFKNDMLADYVLQSQTPATFALIHIYAVVNNFMSFILFGKILSILLFIISIVYAFKIGELCNRRTAFLFGLLFTLHAGSLFYLFSGVVARAFGFPLLLAFVYYIIQKRYLKLSAILILQAIFYPPILIISGLTYLMLLLYRKPNLSHVRNAVLSFLMPMIILLLLFVNSDNLGQAINIKTAMTMPEFYSGGRVPIFRGDIPFTNSIVDTVHSIFNSYTTSITSPVLLNSLVVLGLIALILLMIFRNDLRPRKELIVLGAAGIVGFVASFIFLFYLYLPARYLIFTLPILFIHIICEGFDKINQKISSKNRLIVFTIMFVLLLAFYVPKFHEVHTTCGDKELYLFLDTVPKDSLIAGEPRVANCIPLFSKRSVLVMDELSAAYHIKFYKEIEQRTLDFFDAYYSDSRDQIRKFCSKYGVDYLIVNGYHFSEEYITTNQQREPFKNYIKSITKDKSNFVLLDVPKEEKLFEHKNIFLIRCSAI